MSFLRSADRFIAARFAETVEGDMECSISRKRKENEFIFPLNFVFILCVLLLSSIIVSSFRRIVKLAIRAPMSAVLFHRSYSLVISKERIETWPAPASKSLIGILMQAVLAELALCGRFVFLDD